MISATGKTKVLSLSGIGGVLMPGFAIQGHLWRTVLTMDEFHYLANPRDRQSMRLLIHICPTIGPLNNYDIDPQLDPNPWSRLGNLTIHVSDTSLSSNSQGLPAWQSSPNVHTFPVVGMVQGQIRIKMTDSVTGRYVSVVKQGFNAMHMAEMEVLKHAE